MQRILAGRKLGQARHAPLVGPVGGEVLNQQGSSRGDVGTPPPPLLAEKHPHRAASCHRPSHPALAHPETPAGFPPASPNTWPVGPERGEVVPAPHPPEFRQRAVELAREGSRPIALAAQDIGISESCLGIWLVHADVDEGKRGVCRPRSGETGPAPQGEPGAQDGA